MTIARALVFALVALVVTASACSRERGEGRARDGAILVGAYLSMSGPDSTFGTDTREGIDLAVEHVNAQGGVRGQRVKVVYEDDKSTAQEASQKVRQLIDREHVIALLGEVSSSRSLVGGLIANTSHVPMVTPSSTAVAVTRGRPWVFRTCFTDDQQGEAAARFVRENLHKQRAAILYAAQDTYSSGLAESFRRSFVALGGTIAISKGYQKGETNFTTYLNVIAAEHPDIIFVPNYYSDMVLVARQAKASGLRGDMFMGGDAWDSSDLLEGAGRELEGAYFTNHYAPDVPRASSTAFLAAFRAKYGHDPSSIGAQGYDAARVLFDAIGRARALSPEAVRDALADTNGFVGATGTITIGPEHNANKPVVIIRIKGEKFTYATELVAR